MEQMWDRIAEKGERSGFAESKKQISWFIHGARGSAEVRGRLMTAASPQEAEAILQEFLERCPMENDGDLSQTPEKSAACHDILDLY